MTNWILGEKFLEKAPHTGNLKLLWETKWKFPCSRGIYPFHDGSIDDFEPIFNKLIADGINDAYTDAYTEYFLPTARKLTDAALSAQASDRKKAIDLFKRAACVYRISRFPSMEGGSGIKRQAYEEQKQVYLRGAALWDEPINEVVIPHTAAAGDDGKQIPLYVRLPKGASAANKAPVILLITGLDGHRPDNSGRSDEFLQRGWATVICDIPGVADCPAARADPASPDRLFTSILEWMARQPALNTAACIAWGLSAGGYYAIRAAHTHHAQLAGAVGQGAGTHHFLSREWLEHVDHHEYPFSVTRAFTAKYGYKDLEELMQRGQKEFSLVESGLLDGPHARLLLVNGTWDGLCPIEDSILLMSHGQAKEARFYDKLPHMGYPPANESIYPWMESVMATVT